MLRRAASTESEQFQRAEAEEEETMNALKVQSANIIIHLILLIQVATPFIKVGPKAKSGFQKAKKQLKALLGKGRSEPEGTAFSNESLNHEGPSSSTRRSFKRSKNKYYPA